MLKLETGNAVRDGTNMEFSAISGGNVWVGMGLLKERERDRDRDRETDRQTDRQTDGRTETKRLTDRDRDGERESDRDTEIETDTHSRRHRQTHGHTYNLEATTSLSTEKEIRESARIVNRTKFEALNKR